MSELVEDYQPDVVVEMLGVNDLTWLQGTPEQMVSGTSGWVASARAADPDIDIVLSRIPQPWLPKVAAFNDLLDGLAEELDTPGSRVVAAQSDADLVAVRRHLGHLPPERARRDQDRRGGRGQPGCAGHRHTAAAAAPARPDASSVRDSRPVLSATPALHGANLQWLRSPGSPETETWLRDLTAGEDWHRVGDRTHG